ncbi:M1 family metallopeptidase [Aquilutibacter rugosus]|uniref:M1 family metallopeptidase n=1 Tax=Aquilutibacter rugosus TaxID=3115820 RepID=UPI002F3FE284
MNRTNKRLLIASAVVATALFTVACKPQPATNADSQTAASADKSQAGQQVVDEHSYSQPNVVRTKHIDLDLAVKPDQKIISGTATLTLEWLKQDATQLLLDTRAIKIEKIEGENVHGAWTPLKFEVAAEDKILGSKLTIETPDRPSKVRIVYSTVPEASGLQWLTKEMTEGKKSPFMFSQSQQIHARSWVPLQDTPSVRFTYNAHVTAPKDLMVLMSADNDPKAARDGDYTFKMEQAIPSYLLAIAAGDLVFQTTGNRSGVWAEPTMVAKAAKEFEDTEKMMQTAERLYGPYRWDRYDILVLPPSFPYGGMENPRLTFATPTVITGDKSLVSLVAHELAHSWSGNLVTFSSPKDAWLNEGFTTYVQSRITEDLYGKEMKDMENLIDRQELATEFKAISPGMQRLAMKPQDLPDPDGSSSSTVYAKGAWFLQFLENRYGRETFDAYLKAYFDHFAFQSISTAQMVDYLKTNLIDKYPGKVTMEEVNEWVYEPGIPKDAPTTDSPRFAGVDKARTDFISNGTVPAADATKTWITQEWTHFLSGMPQKLSPEQMTKLDQAFHFTGTTNGEIARIWYPLAVRSGYTAANAELQKFIERVGRRKLIMPIYSELVKSPEGLALAKQAYEKSKASMHPITAGSVAETIEGAAGR